MGKLTLVGLALIVVVFTLSTMECDARRRKRGDHDEKLKSYELTKHNQADKETFPPSHQEKYVFAKEKSKYDIDQYDASRYSKHKFYNKANGDHKLMKKLKKKKGRKHKNKHLPWMKFKPEYDCIPSCQHNEVCISGPIDSKTMCVGKKNLKKSIKLFHRYQKKEMKQWKKFKKDHYNDVFAEKEDWKEEKKSDWDKTKKDHSSKQDFDHAMMKKGKKHLKKPLTPAFVDDGNECSTEDFGGMRNRMMGWFHVLHGQDHLLKKQMKGSLKHFHKHVSVKKELREHEGESCQCFKSAMWQFHEMDENKDNLLDHKELSLVEENTLEPCVKPYLTSCDKDADGLLSSDEWCCCFSSIVAPCFKKLDEIKRSGDKLAYVPRCDKEGYYMREQCQGDSGESDSYGCWCVDYNGNEFKGTFTKGRAHCSKIALRGLEKTPMV